MNICILLLLHMDPTWWPIWMCRKLVQFFTWLFFNWWVSIPDIDEYIRHDVFSIYSMYMLPESATNAASALPAALLWTTHIDQCALPVQVCLCRHGPGAHGGFQAEPVPESRKQRNHSCSQP